MARRTHYNLTKLHMKSVVTIALLAFSLAAQTAKQTPGVRNQEDDTRISVDVTRVQLLFTVSDKKGRFVNNLTRSDFEVFESKKPQSVVEFTAESDLPLRLAILIDTSNSIRDRFKFQQEAASDFVHTVLRPGADKAVIVSFDTAAELVADLNHIARETSFSDDAWEKLLKFVSDNAPDSPAGLKRSA